MNERDWNRRWKLILRSTKKTNYSAFFIELDGNRGRKLILPSTEKTNYSTSFYWTWLKYMKEIYLIYPPLKR